MTTASDLIRNVERQAGDAFLAASAACVETNADVNSDAMRWQQVRAADVALSTPESFASLPTQLRHAAGRLSRKHAATVSIDPTELRRQRDFHDGSRRRDSSTLPQIALIV